jgi:hypothetical protein
MPTPLEMRDIAIAGSTVTVTGAGAQALANSLIQKHSVTLAELADQLGFVDPKNITIDADGSITIASNKIAAKLTGLKAANVVHPMNLNCVC